MSDGSMEDQHLNSYTPQTNYRQQNKGGLTSNEKYFAGLSPYADESPYEDGQRIIRVSNIKCDEENELDSLDSNTANDKQEREKCSSQRIFMSSGSQSARNLINSQQRLKHLPQKDNNCQDDMVLAPNRQVKIESEKSQFTQESCSAAENESQDEAYGGVRNLIQTSAQKMKTEASPDKNDQFKQKPKLQLKGMMHFKSTDQQPDDRVTELVQLQNRYLDENPKDVYNPEAMNFEESKEDGCAPLSGFPLTNRSSPSKENLIFGTFYANQQLLLDAETSAQQNRRRKESNPLSGVPSQQNSHNKMLSNDDYNYSPDFKESTSNQPNPLEQQSNDNFSPLIMLKKSSTFGNNHQFKNQDVMPVLLQKQMLLKYEEFDGDCYTTSSHQNDQVFFSGQSAQHAMHDRRHSERMSDRIYERAEHYTQHSRNDEGDPFSPYNNTVDEEPTYQNPISPQNLFERKLPTLSIISEEETQADHSVYYNRGITGERLSQNDYMQRFSNNQQDYSKSKSVPSMRYNTRQSRSNSRSKRVSPKSREESEEPRTQSQQRLQEGDGERRSSLTPAGISHKNNHSSATQYLLQNTPFNYNKSRSFVPSGEESDLQRKSHDLRVQDVDDDPLMRLHSGSILMRHSNNYQQLISEEDLLSNIDRQSKMQLPGTDFISDEAADLLQKQHTPLSSFKAGEKTAHPYEENNMLHIRCREQGFIIDQLKAEIEQHQRNNQELVLIINQIEQRNAELTTMNEELQSRLASHRDIADLSQASGMRHQPQSELEFTVSNLGLDGNKRDAMIQVNLKRSGSVRGKRFGSNAKSTPKRGDCEPESEILQRSQTTNQAVKEYETPSMRKNQSIVMESISPFNTGIQKSYQQLLDEVSSLQQQLRRERQDYQRHELNYHGEHDQLLQLRDDLYAKLAEKDVTYKQKENHFQSQLLQLNNVKQRLEKTLEGLNAELEESKSKHLEACRIVEQYKQRAGELNDVSDKAISVLLSELKDQEVQTDDIQVKSSQVRSPSHYSMGNTSKKEQSFTLPHTIPLPEMNSTYGDLHQETTPHPSLAQTNQFKRQEQFYTAQPHYAQQPYAQLNANTTNSGYLTPQSITIINNKQELQKQFELQKEYELRSMKIQSDIKEYKNRLIRENQELCRLNSHQKEEFERKLKKREAKIDKYKQESQRLTQLNTEQRLKLDDLQHKLQDSKLKFETKLQEKEFKILMLKSQLKQFYQPHQVNESQLSKVYSQQELLNMINTVIQQRQSFEERPRPRSNLVQGNRSAYVEDRSYLSPEDFLVQEQSRFTKNDSILIPPSAKGSSGMARSRRFENTMIIPNSRVLSPPVIGNQQYPRSVPRVNQSNLFQESHQKDRPEIAIYQEQYLHQDLYQPPNSSSKSNQIYMPPMQVVSRNARRPNTHIQRQSSGIGGQLKSTLSDGDFMQMKWSINQMESLDEAILQKQQCTTEISNLVDERIEESRQRVADANTHYPSLNVEHVNSRRGTSSFQSATFRKLSQHNSPQKNLQQHFEQVKTTPGFVQPSSQKQSCILDQEQEHFDDVKHYQLLPKNLQSIGISSKNSDEQRYLKNLQIREKKSKQQLAPIVQSVSVVSDEYCATNQQSSIEVVKPPIVSSKSSLRNLAPPQIKESSSEAGGSMVNHQYLTRQNSDSRVIVIEESNNRNNVSGPGTQSAKNQKLEDLKRIYGRKQ